MTKSLNIRTEFSVRVASRQLDRSVTNEVWHGVGINTNDRIPSFMQWFVEYRFAGVSDKGTMVFSPYFVGAA